MRIIDWDSAHFVGTAFNENVAEHIRQAQSEGKYPQLIHSHALAEFDKWFLDVFKKLSPVQRQLVDGSLGLTKKQIDDAFVVILRQFEADRATTSLAALSLCT